MTTYSSAKSTVSGIFLGSAVFPAPQRPDASDEMCTIHAGCVVALRCHILQTVIESWHGKGEVVRLCSPLGGFYGFYSLSTSSLVKNCDAMPSSG